MCSSSPPRQGRRLRCVSALGEERGGITRSQAAAASVIFPKDKSDGLSGLGNSPLPSR